MLGDFDKADDKFNAWNPDGTLAPDQVYEPFDGLPDDINGGKGPIPDELKTEAFSRGLG